MKAEAADRLGISVDHLERHVLPELRVIYSGTKVLVPVAEIDAWISKASARALKAR